MLILEVPICIHPFSGLSAIVDVRTLSDVRARFLKTGESRHNRAHSVRMLPNEEKVLCTLYFTGNKGAVSRFVKQSRLVWQPTQCLMRWCAAEREKRGVVATGNRRGEFISLLKGTRGVPSPCVPVRRRRHQGAQAVVMREERGCHDWEVDLCGAELMRKPRHFRYTDHGTLRSSMSYRGETQGR